VGFVTRDVRANQKALESVLASPVHGLRNERPPCTVTARARVHDERADLCTGFRLEKNVRVNVSPTDQLACGLRDLPPR
jgi:hypothetical protein